MQKLNRSTGKQISHLSHEVNHCFMDYGWPGNVRELENAIEHAFVTCQAQTIELADLPLEMRSVRSRAIECQGRGETAALQQSTRDPLTRETLLDALNACGGNQSEAARRLGIDRTTVWRKMKQWEITYP